MLWLEYATDDLAAARRGGRALRPRHVASLAQQAAEKEVTHVENAADLIRAKFIEWGAAA